MMTLFDWRIHKSGGRIRPASHCTFFFIPSIPSMAERDVFEPSGPQGGRKAKWLRKKLKKEYSVPFGKYATRKGRRGRRRQRKARGRGRRGNYGTISRGFPGVKRSYMEAFRKQVSVRFTLTGEMNSQQVFVYNPPPEQVDRVVVINIELTLNFGTTTIPFAYLGIVSLRVYKSHTPVTSLNDRRVLDYCPIKAGPAGELLTTRAGSGMDVSQVVLRRGALSKPMRAGDMIVIQLFPPSYSSPDSVPDFLEIMNASFEKYRRESRSYERWNEGQVKAQGTLSMYMVEAQG